MRVHHLQHDSAEGLGSLEDWFRGRGAGVRTSALHRGDALPALADLDWLVVMGGPMSVNDVGRYPWLLEETRFIADAIAAGRTVLGVCLGSQLVAAALGARVYRAPDREVGWFPVERTPEGASHRLGAALPERFLAFQWHEDTFDLPTGAVSLARSAACANQAFAVGDRVLAVQFHPEMKLDGARALIDAFGDELRPARYVQTAVEMLEDPERFARGNHMMASLLDRIVR